MTYDGPQVLPELVAPLLAGPFSCECPTPGCGSEATLPVDE